MRVLVYGAGVIGSYLAHELCAAGQEVTLLARGGRREELESGGLVIRHYRQRKTTVDRPRIVERPEPGVIYDAVFAVMQAQQMRGALDDLAACATPLLVLVGNNPTAAETEAYLRSRGAAARTILFGFQGTGGRRENGAVVCVRFREGGMTCGLAHGAPDGATRAKLSRLFAGTGYRITYSPDMDAWCKGHLALILPVGYLCYRLDCNLKRAGGRQLRQAMDAVREGYGLLAALGYPILPEGSEAYFRGRPKRACLYALLRIMAATDLGRLAASDHCANAVTEMRTLSGAFDALRERKPDFPMPMWRELERSLPASDAAR